MSNPEKLEVSILDVKEITTYKAPDKPVKQHIVTYRYLDRAPRSLFILEEEDTTENRAKLIRADIKAAEAQGQQTLAV